MAKRSDFIRIRREAAGLTQKELGELANVSGATVSSLENGNILGANTFNAIETALQRYYNHMNSKERAIANIYVNARMMQLNYTTDEELLKICGGTMIALGNLVKSIT